MARKRTVKVKAKKPRVVHARGRSKGMRAPTSDDLKGLTIPDVWKHKGQASGQTGGHSRRIGKI